MCSSSLVTRPSSSASRPSAARTHSVRSSIRSESDRVVLSLDLFRGVARIPDDANWGTLDPQELAHQSIELGIRRLLLLELAHVGTGQGTGTGELFRAIHASRPGVEITVGGGISDIDELVRWRDEGAAAVLVGIGVARWKDRPRPARSHRNEGIGCSRCRSRPRCKVGQRSPTHRERQTPVGWAPLLHPTHLTSPWSVATRWPPLEARRIGRP